MKNIIYGFVMVLLLQGQIIAQVKSSGSDSSKFGAGDHAPDFMQKDIRGNSISMKQFRGKYVILQFWASWCKPCRASSGKLQHLYHQYKGADFDIISISIDNDKNLWMNAIAEDRTYFWSNILDDITVDNSVYRMFGLNAVPNYFLVSPDGTIVNRYLTLTLLEKELEMLTRLGKLKKS